MVGVRAVTHCSGATSVQVVLSCSQKQQGSEQIAFMIEASAPAWGPAWISLNGRG